MDLDYDNLTASELDVDQDLGFGFDDGYEHLGPLHYKPERIAEDGLNLEEESKGEAYQGQIREFFVPTASFLFLIWGVVIMLRKCWKCYKTEFLKNKETGDFA